MTVVDVPGDEASGMARMLSMLIAQNLEAHPERLAHLDGTIAVVRAHDADEEVTITLGPERVSVVGAARYDEAHLVVVADSIALMELPAAPLRWGFPDVARKAGRVHLGRVLSGAVKVRGMWRHPARMARFQKVLSVHDGR